MDPHLALLSAGVAAATIMGTTIGTAAQAASFSVIGTIPGGPQIGAAKGDTLYGTLDYVGDGVLFSFTLNGKYAVLHNFSAATDGAQPNARLALDGAGTITGTAGQGGTYGAGTIWQYSKTAGFSAPHAFGNGGDGSVPMQGPTLGPGGVLYGTTGEGAMNGSGNIWNLANGTYTVMYDFLSKADGHCPFSGVAVSSNGTLYGTTVGVGYGGDPMGSVWTYTTGGILRTLYDFTDGTDGEWPNQAPVVDKQGNVYGTTYIEGGNQFDGAIWTVSGTGTFTLLREMNGATDGAVPNSPLLFGKDGTLYGTTYTGGPGGYGTVFSITKTGIFTVIHGFTAGNDGAQPTGNLVLGAHGVIYGGTEYGSVFEITQ
jgi:uncharacterized repeat protein (TIGR03803 family)